MNWVSDVEEFKRVFLDARRCVFADSGRLPTTLVRLIFDDAELLTRRFAELLQNLQAQSGDEFAWYLVLDPDPDLYFHQTFGSYPLVKISRGLSEAEYLNLLNEHPEDSPVDALGTNWSDSVLLPGSSRWFVHMLRSADDNGGHLWIPPEWKDDILARYPFFHEEPLSYANPATH